MKALSIGHPLLAVVDEDHVNGGVNNAPPPVVLYPHDQIAHVRLVEVLLLEEEDERVFVRVVVDRY